MSSPQSGDGSAGDVPRTLADLARSQPLPPPEIARMLGEVAQALDGAGARGEVYRSVRPENITVDAAGRAALVSPPPDTAEGSLDAVVFASPEQLRGRPLDPRSDQYSLAATAFALLTGTPPYAGSSSTAIVLAHAQDPIPSAAARNPQLPLAVDPVFYRALAKEPAERFDRSGGFVAALDAALGEVPVVPGPVLPPGPVPATPGPAVPGPPVPQAGTAPPLGAEPMTGGRRRSRVPIIVGAFVVVIAVVAGLTAFFLTRSSSGGETAAPPPPRAVIGSDTAQICAAFAGGPLACGSDVDEPEIVAGVTDVSSLYVAGGLACAIAKGQVYCWGNNEYGEHGTGKTSETRTEVPEAVPGMSQATSLSGLGTSVCAVNAGEVYCWGDLRSWMPLDNPPYPATPQKIPGLTGATQLAGSWNTTCALVNESAWCWGKNDHGQTGDRLHPAGTSVPTKVEGLGRVTAISVQSDATCAISDGDPWCWGNINQLLGEKLGGRAHSVPVRIPGFGKLKDIAVSAESVRGDPSPTEPGKYRFESAVFLCGITERGGVMCAGYNGSGQLGTGDRRPSAIPVTVPGVTGAQAIVADYHHACVMAAELQCWGLVYGYGDIWSPRFVNWPR